MSQFTSDLDKEPIIIHLNSKFADTRINNSPSNISFYFQNIISSTQTHIYMRVLDVVIPYSFYQINSSNNFLVYENAAGYKSYITISRGNYNVYQLISELKAQFVNNYINMNVTYNEITNKLTFILDRPAGSPYQEFKFLNTSTCLRLLGFSGTSTSVLQSLTSDNTINLVPTNYICIHSNIYSSYINKSQPSNLLNMLVAIPVLSPPNSLISYQPSSNTCVNTYDYTFNQLSLELTDEYGNEIELNGQEWSMTLELLFYDFVKDGQ
jgi:hypothetical protein